jgi:hypothetical protein
MPLSNRTYNLIRISEIPLRAERLCSRPGVSYLLDVKATPVRLGHTFGLDQESDVGNDRINPLISRGYR